MPTTPYDPRKLSPELRAALTPYAAYRTTARLRALLEPDAAPPAEALVCLAWLEWSDALATDFDEDVIQSGGVALAELARARALEPTHAGALGLERVISRRIKAARREIKKVEKLASVPEDTLSLEDAKELVFVILDNAHASPALLLKAHRLATRLVREHPDVTQGSRPIGTPGEFHGHTYYHSGQAASALWRAGEREAARPLLWALIAWPVARDARLYDFCLGDSLASLMLEAVEQGDPAELSRLLLELQSRFGDIGREVSGKQLASGTVLTVLPDAVCDRLLTFGAERCAPAALAVLVELHAKRGEASLKKDSKLHLAAARARLLAVGAR